MRTFICAEGRLEAGSLRPEHFRHSLPQPTADRGGSQGAGAGQQQHGQQQQQQQQQQHQHHCLQGVGSSRSNSWCFTSAYALNTEGLLPRIMELAHQVRPPGALQGVLTQCAAGVITRCAVGCGHPVRCRVCSPSVLQV